MKRETKKNWKKRINKKIKPLPLPYQVESYKNYLFMFDIEEWGIDEVSKFSEYLGKCYPENGFAFMPNTMGLHSTTITGKEYTMINNILKRMKNEK